MTNETKTNEPRNLETWIRLGKNAGLTEEQVKTLAEGLVPLAQIFVAILAANPEEAPNLLAIEFADDDGGPGWEFVFRRRTQKARVAMAKHMSREAVRQEFLQSTAQEEP